MRIGSLFPSATELLYALGLGRAIVGRSERCDYPPVARRKPVIVRSRIAAGALDSRGIHEAVESLRRAGQHQYDVNVPLLRRLRPDLVVTQELCSICAVGHPEVAEALRQLPRPPRAVTISTRRFEELFGAVEALGRATGRSAHADRLVRQWRRAIAAVQQPLAGIPARPRVWCAEWLDPLMAAGHWIPEMVAMAGGVDGLGQAGEESRRIAWGQVQAYDPEVIVVMPCSFSLRRTRRELSLLTRRPGWGALRAVRAGRVYAVDTGLFHRPGPRLVAGLQVLAALCHPARFPPPAPVHAQRVG